MSRPISLATLLEGWCALPPGSPLAALAVGGLATEARRVNPGDAFVAVAGQALAHAAEAVARGAAVVLHDGAAPSPDLSVPVLALPGLDDRLAELGARFHRHPAEQMTLAGVTGARGKTTTAHFIAQSWQRAAGGAGLVSDLGRGPFAAAPAADPGPLDPVALHGVLADCAARGLERAVLEFSPRVVDPAVAGTGLEALAFTTAAGADESAWLGHFETAHPRFAVINHDDPAGKALSRRIGNGTQVLTCGSNGATELRGAVLGMDASGMTLRIASPWGGGEVRTGLLGAHNLDNLLCAVGVLALLGMPWNRVMHQVEIMQSAPGRLEALAGGSGRPALVRDRAADAGALRHTLTALRSHLHGRLACVVAGDAAQGANERAALAAVAGTLSDRVVLTVGDAGDANPWTILDGMARGLGRLDGARVIADRVEAVRAAVDESAPGDIVLVAGRGGCGWLDTAERRAGASDALADLLEDAA